jgi:hypothetical protein
MTKNREAAWVGRELPALHALAGPAPDGRRPTRDRRSELLGRTGFRTEEIAPLRLSTGILKASAQRHPLGRVLPRAHRVAWPDAGE